MAGVQYGWVLLVAFGGLLVFSLVFRFCGFDFSGCASERPAA